MDELTLNQKQKFESIWAPEAQGHYRKGSCGQRLVPEFVRVTNAPFVVNDYGSGTGRSAVELAKLGYTVRMFDIASNALEDEAKSMLGGKLSFREANLWDLPDDIEKTPWGFCVDVLMLIPPEKIDATLAGISRTCDNCFFEVYAWSYKWREVEYTVTQWDAQKWLEKFKEYWPDVKQLQIPGQEPRMIFVAKK